MPSCWSGRSREHFDQPFQSSKVLTIVGEAGLELKIIRCITTKEEDEMDLHSFEPRCRLLMFEDVHFGGASSSSLKLWTFLSAFVFSNSYNFFFF